MDWRLKKKGIAVVEAGEEEEKLKLDVRERVETFSGTGKWPSLA